MPKLLLLLVITETSSDSLEFQTIDINNASYEELYSIPLLTDEDIQKILKQRSYKNFKEFADSLNLSNLEIEVLRNYLFFSKNKEFSSKVLISLKYDSTIDFRHSLKVEYKNLKIYSLRNRIYLGYKKFYFGNVRISKGLGLIGTSYYRTNTKTGIYFSNSIGLIMNFKNFDIFADSNKNYAIIYNYKNSYFGVLGKENLNLFLAMGYKFLLFEVIKSKNYLNYAYSLNFENEKIDAKLVYRNIFEDYWDYSNKTETFFISARIKNYPIRVYSRFSNNYYNHSVNYEITDGSNIELKFSKSYYKFEFSNEEGLKLALFNNKAIKIGYKFFSIYQYKDISTICDEYIPLYGCYKKLEQNQNYIIAIDFKYKFWGAFITRNYAYVYFMIRY
ncbi:MAG: hypothetical protein ABIL24_08720 [candidate division WOR-3 bacterium]